jgi:hypothetical protein
MSIRLDEYRAVIDDDSASLDRNYARWRYYCASLYVELAVVEVAFDQITVDITLGQRTRIVRASIILFLSEHGNSATR